MPPGPTCNYGPLTMKQWQYLPNQPLTRRPRVQYSLAVPFPPSVFLLTVTTSFFLQNPYTNRWGHLDASSLLMITQSARNAIMRKRDGLGRGKGQTRRKPAQSQRQRLVTTESLGQSTESHFFSPSNPKPPTTKNFLLNTIPYTLEMDRIK